MVFTETKLAGAFIVDVQRLTDERGFFGRSWCQDEFAAHGILAPPVQANLSSNPRKGTLRGLHYQLPPHEETKLVRCTRGAICDVVVDLREESPTFKQWVAVELTADNYRMLFVPGRFAHGFITLADHTDVAYQVSAAYAPGAERGLRWNDPALGIAWPLAPVLVSAKDAAHPDFQPPTLQPSTLQPAIAAVPLPGAAS